MSKEKKVWMVDKGDYSDYRVDSIWSTRRKAEKHSKMIQGHVREIILNKCSNPNGVGYYFRFNEKGELQGERVNEYIESDENIDEPYFDEESKEMEIEVFSNNRDKAFKIACDKRANFLAQLNGI